MKTIVAFVALAAAGMLAACATDEESQSFFNSSAPAPVLAQADQAQAESEAAR